jgi:DNA-binding FadR family transcriptional regulator
VTARDHKSITKAIRDKDAEAAGRRMRRHVHSYAAAVLKVDQRDSITVED